MNEVIERYLRDFKRVGKKEKIIIIIILVAAFFIGIAGSYIYKNLTFKPTTDNRQLITSPSPLPKSALLTLIGQKKIVTVGDKFDVTMKLNSGNLGVEAADFIVNFDPDYLKVASVSSGIFFKNYPINTTGNNFVKIAGVADFTSKTIVVPKGEGSVATISFETLQATESTKISFDRVKTIIASSGQNILNTAILSDLNIKISE